MKVKGLILGGALLMSAGVVNAGSNPPNPVAWLLEAVQTNGPGNPVNLTALQVFNGGAGQAGMCKQAAKAVNSGDLRGYCSDPMGPCYVAASCVKIFEVGGAK